MKKITLHADKRTLLGRKIKQLRSQGWIPANIFGKGVKSAAVQLKKDEFTKIFSQAGETKLVELSLGDTDMRPVLIQNVQMHPVSRLILHVDLHQVDLKEKIRAKIPLEIVGVAAAVEQKLGVLLNLLDEIEVEALPTDLPEKISVDVTKLDQVGAIVKIKDLPLGTQVKVLTDLETDIVKIGALVTKEAAALAQEEAAAAAATVAATTPAAEGEVTPTAATTAETKTEAKPVGPGEKAAKQPEA